MILKLHALLLLDLLMKVEKVGCSACLKLSSLWAEGNSRSKSDLCQHKPWKVKSLYEMDVFTPTLCSLERDSSMMNNVMGNKSVFGHCVFNIKNTSQRSAFFFFFFRPVTFHVAKEQCVCFIILNSSVLIVLPLWHRSGKQDLCFYFHLTVSHAGLSFDSNSIQMCYCNLEWEMTCSLLFFNPLTMHHHHDKPPSQSYTGIVTIATADKVMWRKKVGFQTGRWQLFKHDNNIQEKYSKMSRWRCHQILPPT